jgi:hypothetical protein
LDVLRSDAKKDGSGGRRKIYPENWADAVQKPTTHEIEAAHEHAHDADEIQDLTEDIDSPRQLVESTRTLITRHRHHMDATTPPPGRAP